MKKLLILIIIALIWWNVHDSVIMDNALKGCREENSKIIHNYD